MCLIRSREKGRGEETKTLRCSDTFKAAVRGWAAAGKCHLIREEKLSAGRVNKWWLLIRFVQAYGDLLCGLARLWMITKGETQGSSDLWLIKTILWKVHWVLKRSQYCSFDRDVTLSDWLPPQPNKHHPWQDGTNFLFRWESVSVARSRKLIDEICGCILGSPWCELQQYMMPLSHAVSLTKTDGSREKAKLRHQPPSSPQRGCWWIQHCARLILAAEDTCRARTFGINHTYRETFT